MAAGVIIAGTMEDVEPALIEQVTVYEVQEDVGMGEDLGLDLGRDVARHANSLVGKDRSETTSLPIDELGNPVASEVRFSDSAKRGFLTAYVRTREVVSEHKTASTITVSTIAIGAVLAGIHHLKYKKK